MTPRLHIYLLVIVFVTIGGGLFFMYVGRPFTAFFMLLMGIFLMLVQIFVAIKIRP
jgi:hypothetical protein